MLVLKFGGTSVGSIENMNNVRSIINDGTQKIVVLSAMSGTTNALVEISEQLNAGDRDNALELIEELLVKYAQVIEDLLQNKQLKEEVSKYVLSVYETLIEQTKSKYNELVHNTIVAQGELLSTFIFSRFLIQEGINAVLLPALDFMRVDQQHEPDSFYIQQNLNRIIDDNQQADIYITQGFICLDVQGQISNLQRGGSDYTASIIGAAIQAEEVQIWTDIDGFHNNDPRYVENTTAIQKISFDEAAELAYFGAKICIHKPLCRLEI
ncbi:aspartokinase [Nonlabens tegetincola]|uniref:Aspartokinase n=1 Tax=Nonlabens tegetincola TaxID=323273 RepID=A0A090Q122_9FLAO|nr:aspartokinase [Nonlabens tegetincola]